MDGLGEPETGLAGPVPAGSGRRAATGAADAATRAADATDSPGEEQALGRLTWIAFVSADSRFELFQKTDQQGKAHASSIQSSWGVALMWAGV